MTNSLSSSVSSPRTFKILSIDGGGIKGLYSARILEHFESKFGCRIAEYFDLICGTSTGGLIALALSLEIPVKEISKLYCDKGNKIFPKQNLFISFLKQVLLCGKYSNKELKKELKNIFGEKIIGNSKCLLCIPAFSLTDGRPFVFKFDHIEGSLCRDNQTKYIDVALATSAAPSYLPIVTIDTYEKKQFIDGGVYANNPTLVGVTEALRYFVGKDKSFKKLMVLSLGSLEPNPGRRFIKKHNRSIVDWNTDLVATFFEGQAYLTSYCIETLSQHCDSPFTYLRIPGADLSPEQARIINLDNSSTEAVRLISQKGKDQAYIWSKKSEIAEFFNDKKQYLITN